MKQLSLILSLLFISSISFSQTKKELEDKIIRQQKTIDSLQAVADNWENVVESRNRTIKFLREDTANLNDDIQILYSKIRSKNQELVSLRNQTKTGTAKMFGMSNNRNTLRVPEGKHWIINQVITDYITDLVPDSSGTLVGTEVFVFIKSINDEVLTDHTKNLYGPLLYSSMHPERSLQFPIILTENTKIQFQLLQGKIGQLTEYTGKAYCTYFEKDN